MAGESIAELQRYASSVKVPGPADKVFKDECAYSFDTPESKDGLYISMVSFLGLGRQHLEKYYDRTKHSVFLNYKRIKHELPKEESQGEEAKKPTRLAIGVEGGFDLDAARYRVEEEFNIVLMPGYRVVPLTSADVPDQIRASASAIIASDSAAKQAELAALSGTWEGDVRQVSKHAATLVQLDNGVKIPPGGWKCKLCDLRDNLWLNLTDGSILCGRKFWDGTGGNNHAVEYYQEKGYPLAVKLGTITPESADVYSYDEDDMVIDPLLPAHLAHFGIDIMKLKKTDKTMTELELDLNQRSWEWSALTESGSELKPLYGPGCTGIHNLGNSCYMNSVMQVVFTLPPFIDKYYKPAVRIFDENVGSDPTSNFNVQMAKFAQGLLSGDYSKDPDVAKDGNQHTVNGIRPLMFKTLIGQGHAEFSTKRQQDAQEFLLHLFNVIERNSRGSLNPVDSIKFEIEDRVECTQSHRVRYMQRDELCLTLGVPLECATNKEELARFNAEKEQCEAQGIQFDSSRVVRPRIPLSACLQTFAAASAVEDFYSSAIRARTTAKKTTRMKSFPDYLFIHMQKFTIGSDWVERKLDVSLDIPDELDISDLRGRGKQAGEEELPEDNQPTAAPAAPVLNETFVGQLVEMGFPLEGSKRAVYYTRDASDMEAALNWAMEHVGDPDFSSPFEVPSGGGQQQHHQEDQLMLNEESLTMIMSLGFTRDQATRALRATDNNVERAADWIFSHADELNEPENIGGQQQQMQPATGAAAAAKQYTDGPGRYRLEAFISHMGSSTKVGHYVCHIRKPDGRWVIYNDEKVALSEHPPVDLAYLYLYRRVQ